MPKKKRSVRIVFRQRLTLRHDDTDDTSSPLALPVRSDRYSVSSMVCVAMRLMRSASTCLGTLQRTRQLPESDPVLVSLRPSQRVGEPWQLTLRFVLLLNSCVRKSRYRPMLRRLLYSVVSCPPALSPRLRSGGYNHRPCFVRSED